MSNIAIVNNPFKSTRHTVRRTLQLIQGDARPLLEWCCLVGVVVNYIRKTVNLGAGGKLLDEFSLAVIYWIGNVHLQCAASSRQTDDWVLCG